MSHLSKLKEALENRYPEINIKYHNDRAIECIIIKHKNINFWISSIFVYATDYLINDSYYKIYPYEELFIKDIPIEELCPLIYSFINNDPGVETRRRALDIASDIMGNYTEDGELLKACEIIINVLNGKTISKT